MRSLASASSLLSKCSNLDGATALLAQLGFPNKPVALTAQGETALDLSEDALDVRICAGRGALRALTFSTAGNSLREIVAEVAARLSKNAPQLLFLIVAMDTRNRRTALAVFDSFRSRARVSALVVDIDNIVDSDAETICALAAATSTSSVLTYARWLEILGRDSINRRFFLELEHVVASLADSFSDVVCNQEARELALLCTSRLLFLSFLQTKGWLNNDHAFLPNGFADCMVTGGEYHRRTLNPLFFGTLNTHPTRRAKRAREFGRVPFLNGGLFARSPLESRNPRAYFSDEALGDAFGDLLSRYRFTAREDGTSWTEAAIDPEMLGKAFESLMSSTDRKQSGAFYTPQSLVREVCHSAVSYGLASPSVPSEIVSAALEGDIPTAANRQTLLETIAAVRILDPACGSGAFLVHTLEELASLRIRLGDLRALHAVRRDILTRSIFGVDLNPMAAWLCELRLWLAMAIEDPEPDPLKVTPLPNLDRNIRTGDSLSGDGFNERFPRREGNRIALLRSRYARATGPRKRTLSRALDTMERAFAVTVEERRLVRLTHERREMLLMLRSRDLFGSRSSPSSESHEMLRKMRREIGDARARLRKLRNGSSMSFSFSSGFADAAADGGFRIVVGNPPWIRTGNLDVQQRREFRERFDVYRNSAWKGGAMLASAATGFASQVDAAALFVERCMDVVQPGGTISLILPAKLWRSLAGGGVRAFLHDRAQLQEVHDLTSAPQIFDAAVYPSVISATRATPADSRAGTVNAVSHRGDEIVRWKINSECLPFDESRGSPWIIVPRHVRAAFDAVREAGVAMASGPIGRPVLGVKTGCNEVFLVSASAPIEPSLLRPVIRGDHVRPWLVPPGDDRIIWTHDDRGPVKNLPSDALRWFSRWRRTLEQRADSRGRHRWWMLFRTEAADSSRPRVVWSDIGKRPRAAVIPCGDWSVPLNTCYVARCDDLADAAALAAVLNSNLAACWLALLAEPARGGYLRFMGWTMSLLPLPRDWAAARQILSPIGVAAMSGNPPSDRDLMQAVLRAYGLSFDDVAPLIEWSQ